MWRSKGRHAASRDGFFFSPLVRTDAELAGRGGCFFAGGGGTEVNTSLCPAAQRFRDCIVRREADRRRGKPRKTSSLDGEAGGSARC